MSDQLDERATKLINRANNRLQGKKRAMKQGRLPANEEKLARALLNPADFGELVLGYDLSKKQREALLACADEGSMVSIAAANGAGKTSRILPALVLWHQSLWPAGKVKCTSGAFQQIKDQVWPAILMHKDKFPHWKWLETPRFESKDDNGRAGFFVGFTTNEPGKAEGDHPDGPDVPLLFIVDECKTAPIWLKGVIEGRVRPTRLVLMSSHGFSEGWFFETHRMNPTKKFVNITISAYDCPWITKEEIEQVRKDFHGQPEFADSVLGLDFMPLVQDAIINGKALDDNLANPPQANPQGQMHAFCDFAWSGSGNKNVLALRRGNIVSIEASFHCTHLIASMKHPEPGIVEQFIQHFLRLGLSPSQISGDEGGGGKLVMDALDRAGWQLNRVNNGAPASDPDHYANTGAEIWFEAGKHITLKTFVLPPEMTFRGQALSRKRKRNDKGKLACESKEEMAERGVASPDEADAVFGAMMPGGGFSQEAISYCFPMAVGRPLDRFV
jgi:hypothetical protein